MSERSSESKRTRRRPWVVVGAYVVLGIVFYSAGLRLFNENPWLQTPFETPPFDRHIDEYAWYHYTYHYDLYFHQHALDHLAWGHDVPAIGQPNTYKFVLGRLLDRHQVPVNTDEVLMREWWQPITDDEVFKVFLEEHLSFSDQALMVGRFYSAVFSYLTIVLCVVLMSRRGGLLVGVAAGVFFANLELFGVTRMMSDSLLLFAFLVCFLLYDLIVSTSWSFLRPALILVYSVVVGLTMGIKLTGFLIVGFLPVYFAVRCLRERSRDACRDGALWSLVHVGVASSVFVLLHPQTWDNPIVGVFRFFSHQAPVTLEGGQNLLSRAWGELVYQIGRLGYNLGDIFFLESLSGVWFLVIVVLLVSGFAALLIGGRDRGERLEREVPFLVTIAASLLMLSHTLDERYTWILTVVLGFYVVLGLQFLVANFRILFAAPEADEEAE